MAGRMYALCVLIFGLVLVCAGISALAAGPGGWVSSVGLDKAFTPWPILGGVLLLRAGLRTGRRMRGLARWARRCVVIASLPEDLPLLPFIVWCIAFQLAGPPAGAPNWVWWILLGVLVCLMFAMRLLGKWIVRQDSWRLKGHTLCQNCGYIVGHCGSRRCPECGWCLLDQPIRLSIGPDVEILLR